MGILLNKDFNVDEISFKNLDGFKELLKYIESTEIPNKKSTSRTANFSVGLNSSFSSNGFEKFSLDKVKKNHIPNNTGAAT